VLGLEEQVKLNASLQEALRSLEASRQRIQEQNAELQSLATTDSLTGCGNRRSLYAALDLHWASARRYGHALSCVLVDIDHFKAVNDEHGHAAGDRVLAAVGAALREAARETDTVYRYGGEEFIIVVPHTDLVAARLAAERLRLRVAATLIDEVSVTASFGVATSDQGATNPQQMIEQADKALYAAKRAGRNRVVCYSEVEGADATAPPAVVSMRMAATSAAIPFRAIAALMEVLGARDSATAQHCMRVADLCVLLGGELMPPEQLYLLEVAALLHDIGKLGVPDSVLLKSGPLNDVEKQTMAAHDKLGVSIILSALGSAELAQIVEAHHAWYFGRPDQPNLPAGERIPLSARIIAIADAFDAMVSDRPYRNAVSREAAFAELKRSAGKQFDPKLVERFIAIGSRAISPEGAALAA
jgi:diguanylate cyclase (GGDEF)-like protein/putative nucleotidyltransferase with HDIG domain